MHSIKMLSAGALISMAVLALAQAEVPTEMNVQGRLTDASGTPLSLVAPLFEFSIWDSQIGGTQVWPIGFTEPQVILTDAMGLWNASIGSLAPLTEAVFADSSRWLQITVDNGSGPDTLPRVKLVTVPFAFRAGSSQKADTAYALVGGGSGPYLPLAGGTMTGSITNNGDPAITMGKGNFGHNNTNTGSNAFVAGQDNIASGGASSIAGGADNTASGDISFIGGGQGNAASGIAAGVGGGAGNLAADSGSFVGGGFNNHSAGAYSSVVGGSGNIASGYQSSVGGGQGNRARGDYAVVAGGGGEGNDSNSAIGGWSAVGGGRGNTASGSRSTVAGGYENDVPDSAGDAFVGGGVFNQAANDLSAVVGGGNNRAGGGNSFIGGGWFNRADQGNTVVAGGTENEATGWNAFIGSGARNLARGDFSVAVGGGGLFVGDSNAAFGDYSIIIGGRGNDAYGDLSLVGGGYMNLASDSGSAVLSGGNNFARGAWSVVCGGGRSSLSDSNSAQGEFSFIGSGRKNVALDIQASVVGGYSNSASWAGCFVGGGSWNSAWGTDALVVGGQSNGVSSHFGAIVGGTIDTILHDGESGFIGGGSFNRVEDTAGAVCGGRSNVVAAPYGAIGGGRSNTAAGRFAVVPGGDSCAAEGFASFAAGYHAKALDAGSFVWADSIGGDFASNQHSEFAVRARNGVRTEANNSSFGARFENSGAGDGVRAYGNTSAGINWAALYAHNTGTSPAIYAQSSAGPAAFLDGPVTVTGFLTKGGGGFKIDHPLDPENKYLNHSFVESPDMKNIYDGTVTLDVRGEALIELPSWFEALNRDFRYQLTCVGGYAPVYVAERLQNNRFRIAGGTPSLEVSWQITGIRKDAFANANRLVVEEPKIGAERGRYLHPEAFGLSKQEGIAGIAEKDRTH